MVHLEPNKTTFLWRCPDGNYYFTHFINRALRAVQGGSTGGWRCFSVNRFPLFQRSQSVTYLSSFSVTRRSCWPELTATLSSKCSCTGTSVFWHLSNICFRLRVKEPVWISNWELCDCTSKFQGTNERLQDKMPLIYHGDILYSHAVP